MPVRNALLISGLGRIFKTIKNTVLVGTCIVYRLLHQYDKKSTLMTGYGAIDMMSEGPDSRLAG